MLHEMILEKYKERQRCDSADMVMNGAQHSRPRFLMGAPPLAPKQMQQQQAPQQQPLQSSFAGFNGGMQVPSVIGGMEGNCRYEMPSQMMDDSS